MLYCAHPGCSAKVKRGHCPEHTKAQQKRDRWERGTSAQRGYDARWRKVRDRKLKVEPLCEPCQANGRTTAASEVDHIVPLNDGGARLAWRNLQSICRECHASKTWAERR